MEENSDFIIVVAKVKLKTNNKSIKELKSSKRKVIQMNHLPNQQHIYRQRSNAFNLQNFNVQEKRSTSKLTSPVDECNRSLAHLCPHR